MQDWPEGAPATLHTLAALMISRSDNTATDLLLHAAGRENVEAMMERIGIAAAARNRPFLSTAEAFALKGGPPALAQAWIAGNEAARRRLLAGAVAAVPLGSIDLARFVAAPAHIESVEWFASAADLARVMDWFRREVSSEARAILGISPGPTVRRAEGETYIGFKGGSETGVINLTWLVRSEAGVWHAVAATWNDPAAPVDNDRFLALASRAVQLVR
jgi:hypothetical protein